MDSELDMADLESFSMLLFSSAVDFSMLFSGVVDFSIASVEAVFDM